MAHGAGGGCAGKVTAGRSGLGLPACLELTLACAPDAQTTASTQCLAACLTSCLVHDGVHTLSAVLCRGVSACMCVCVVQAAGQRCAQTLTPWRRRCHRHL